MLTPNEVRLLTVREAISGRVWNEAQWFDGRKVIATGPGGNLLSDVAIVLPGTVHRRAGGDWVGAEGVETTWEAIALTLAGNKIFGPGTGIKRPYRDPPKGWNDEAS